MSTVFILALVISFVGSLQLGVVNVMVVKTTLRSGFHSARIVAIGGALPEFLYALVAAAGVSLLADYMKWIEWLIVLLFLVLGVYNIRHIPVPIKTQEYSTSKKHKEFMLGLGIGMLNIQLVVFWGTVALYLQSFGIFTENGWIYRIAFACGAAVGAFLLLLLFAYIAHKKKEAITAHFNGTMITRIVGCFFILLALIKLVSFFVHKPL